MIRLLALLTLALAACGPLPGPPFDGVANQSPSPSGPPRLFAVERANAPALLAAGESRLVSVRVENRGTAVWVPDGRTGVTYHWEPAAADAARGEVTPFSDEVPPAARADVVVPVTAPAAIGAYTLVWDVVDRDGPLEGAPDARRLSVEVKAPDARASWDAVTAPEHVYADVEATVAVTLTNSGTVAWPAKGDGAVALSYHWRDASGRSVVWDGVRTALGATVLPGERMDASVHVAGPSAPGRYVLELDLVREGQGWFGGGSKVALDVSAPSRQSVIDLVGAPQRVTAGQPVDVTVALRNPGGAPWPNAGDRRVRLSYHVANANAVFVVWDGPRSDLPAAVAPGESLQMKATVRAPNAPGRYKLRFDLVQDGVAWFDRLGNVPLDVSIDVVPVDHKAYFKAAETASTMGTGLEYAVRSTVVNVGESTWSSRGFDPIRLGAHWLDADGGVVVWDAARADLPDDVGPAASISTIIRVKAPDRPGTYRLVIDAVQEGISWFAAKGTLPASLAITVAPPTFAATVAGAPPSHAAAGEIVRVPITVRNDGPFPWAVNGAYPVDVAHHWRTPAGAVVVWDGFRTPLPHDVAPGELVPLDAWIFVPATPGTYDLQLDVVQEGVTWFADRGSAVLQQRVEVSP